MSTTTRTRRLAGLALAAALTVGAGGPVTAAAPLTPSTAGGSPSAAGTGPASSAGCGHALIQEPGSSSTQTLTSGGRERSYVLHLPEGYRADRSWPVVLVYHGRGNTGAGTQAFAGTDELPAIVAYPEGVIGTGSGQRQAWEGAPYSAPGVDDVAFTADLLDHLEANQCVDRRRVYATGKSNGAGLVGLLGCDLSERITAIAPVASANYAVGHPTCEPQRPVPVLAFHGTDDVTIPYAGDADRGLPPIPQWVETWAQRNTCSGAVRTTSLTEDTERTTYRGCERGAQVELVSVLGGGHTWPGADSYSGGGYTTQTIETHELLWDALSRHRLPQEGLAR